MSEFVMRAIGYANGMPCHFSGQWLEWYDPNTRNQHTAMAGFTDDIAKAKRFDSVFAAMSEWNRVREVDPVRPDGKTNKPLTAITVTVDPVG